MGRVPPPQRYGQAEETQGMWGRGKVLAQVIPAYFQGAMADGGEFQACQGCKNLLPEIA